MREHYLNMIEIVKQNPELFVLIGLLLAVLSIFGFRIPIFNFLKKIFAIFSREAEVIEASTLDYYKFIWKDVSELTPRDVLDTRGMKKYGYREYYYERDFHGELIKRIREGKDAIVVGMSLSGKTRTVYQALKSLGKGYSVTLLEKLELEKTDLRVPPIKCWRSKKKRVLVIDDINNFIGNQNFMLLLNRFMAEDVTVVATCRTGPELAGYKGTELSTLFWKPLEIPRLEDGEADLVAKEADVQPPDRFDGNIGSLFLPLSLMKVRYSRLEREEKRILKAINRLHFGGVFDTKGIFAIDRVKRYYEEKNSLKIDEGEFKNLLEDLSEKEFLELEINRVRIEEAYIDKVIEGGKPTPEEFAEMGNIFNNDPDALSNLGTRAHEIGLYDIKKNDYIKVSIFAKRRALSFWTKSNNRYKYASTICNLAVSYNELATIEGNPNNLKDAIKMNYEALSVFTEEEFLIEYSITQNNLGINYRRLSGKEKPSENLRKSIESYEKALDTFKIEKFPIHFAITKNNIGISYNELAKKCNDLGLKDKAVENINNAIEAYNVSLKIRTLDKFPLHYADTQNNLGISFFYLANIEKTDKYLKNAIKAFGNALKVRTKEEFPIEYAMTMGSIGNLLNYMAKLGNKEENCKKARIVYNEALEIFKRAGIAQYIKSTEKNIEELNEICNEEGE